MTEKTAIRIIGQLEKEKYLDAIQCLQDAILKIEVKPKMTGEDRKKKKAILSIIDKISEAAAFGSEWDEGARALKSAVSKLQKLSAG